MFKINFYIKNIKSPKAVGMIEALAVIVLVGVVGLGLTQNMNNHLRTGQRFRVREAAESLVRSQLEVYSMVNPNSLTTGTATSNNITYANLGSRYTFNRVTTIVSNSTLISITVTVTSNHSLFPMTYTGTVDFAKW